ncbi:hypothetical protein FPQ18DRAFT_425490, partial [Pyronema domesticum]
RREGTLQWILQHQRYQDWVRLDKTGESQLLWISGHPGSRKTVLSRFLLESIEGSLKEQGTDHKHHVLYFFFDDMEEKQKTALSLLRALLHQIIRKIPSLISHVT